MINSTQKSRSAEILLFYSWLLAPRFFLCKNNWNRLSRRGEREAYRASPTLGTRCGEAIQIDSWTFDSDSLCGYWRNPERSRRPLAPPRPGDADVPTPPPPPPPSSKHSGIAGSRHYEGGYAIDSRTPWCREKLLLLSPLFAFRVYTWNPRILQQAIATRCGSTKEVQGRKTESSNDRGTAIESKCQRIESVHLYIYKLLFTRFDSLTFRLNGRSSDRPVSGCWYSRFLIDRL